MARETALDRRRAALQQAARSQTGGNRMLATFSGLFLTVAFAVFLLFLANTREGLDLGSDLATTLVAAEFIAAAMLLYLASASSEVRVSMQMVMIFLTIYLLLPGFHHTSGNIFPFYSMHYADEVRIQAATIISVFMICLVVGYVVGNNFPKIRPGQGLIAREIVFPNKLLLMTFTGIAAVATAVYVAAVGIDGVFGIRTGVSVGTDDKAAMGLLITLPRTVTFVAFAYCYILLLRAQKAGMGLFYLIVNTPLFFVTNFPLALPRYFLFGIILFFLVQTYNFRGSLNRLGLTGAFVLGALVAMPYMDSLTRHVGMEGANNFAEYFSDYLDSGDFDGLQSIQNAVIYVERNGTQNGIQMLSAGLFFIPRSIWTGKGEPTGVITSREAGFEFNNISQPLPSEMYVDFGMSGVIALSLLLGYALARLDGWITRNWDSGPRARLIAGVVVAFGIILMRGTLLGIVPPIAVFSAGVAAVIAVGLRNPEKIILRGRRAEMARKALRPAGASPRRDARRV